MFTMELLFVDSFISDFKGRQYEIFTFVDPTSLSIIRGTNIINGTLEKGKIYKCTIGYKNNRLIVESVK